MSEPTPLTPQQLAALNAACRQIATAWAHAAQQIAAAVAELTRAVAPTLNGYRAALADDDPFPGRCPWPARDSNGLPMGRCVLAHGHLVPCRLPHVPCGRGSCALEGGHAGDCAC